jgi:putative effector of murein hydrolase
MLRLVAVIASVSLTLLVFRTASAVHERLRSPLSSPVFVATVCIMAMLAASGVDYAPYRTGAEPLTALLGPATAALAVPLYKHRRTLLAHLMPALAGVLCGAIATLVSAVALAAALGLAPVVARSLGIKSVTASIAVELAPIVGGDPALTVALVVATGILGAMLGPWLLDRTGVNDPVARGLAYGTVALGIGTAQAASEGEIQGAVAGIAMGMAGVVVSMSAPALLAWLIHVLIR